MKVQKRHSPEKERGFSMVGVMVAIVVASLFLAAATMGLLGQTDNAKLSGAQDNLTDVFRSNIYGYAATAGYPAGNQRDITGALVRRGLSPTTTWDREWSAAYEGSGQTGYAVVTYPIGNTDDSDANQKAQDMANALSNTSKYPFLASSEADGDSIVVKYRLP